MNIIQALILGVVEGLTEFLPVSSTFHLIWTSRFLSLPQSESLKLFEVVIQAGAILAVIFLYAKEIFTNRRLFSSLVVSFIPTAAVGFILYKLIKGFFFENLWLTTSVFILVGILFIFFEKLIAKGFVKKHRNVDTMTMKEAASIGLLQSFAVVPGVSRAGAVISGMLLMGYRREDAAKYSFMLAIPTILAAAALDLIKMRDILSNQQSDTLMFLGLGTIVAFASAYVVMRWFIRYLAHQSLVFFGMYRIIAGIILLGVLATHP